MPRRRYSGREIISHAYRLAVGAYMDVAIALLLLLGIAACWLLLAPTGGVAVGIFVAVPLGVLVGFVLAVFLLGPALFLHQVGEDASEIRRLLESTAGSQDDKLAHSRDADADGS